MNPQTSAPRWQGVLAGLLATFSGLALAHLFAGLVRDSISPVTAVGSEFIDIVPPWLKELAIRWFGTNDKIALQAGIFATLAVVGAIVGVIALRHSRPAAYTITTVIGFIGAYAVWMRPDPSAIKLLSTVVGTVVSLVVLRWLVNAAVTSADQAKATVEDHSLTSDEEQTGALAEGTDTAAVVNYVEATDDATAAVSAYDRRSFVRGATTVGVVSVVAAGLGETLASRFEIGDERASLQIPDADAVSSVTTPSSGTFDVADYTVDGVNAPQPTSVLGEVAGDSDLGIEGVQAFRVPNSDYYRIDTALEVPQVSVDNWKLRIHGMVDNELELTFDDLLSRPQIERDITLSCVSNEVGGGLVGNALWQGVRLADVLNEAGIQPGATQVVSRSVDGWNCGSPTAAIMDGRDALLAFVMNGEPLPAEHGYPVRLVVPGLYGYVSATKWVTDIELTRWEDFDGYWVPRGWSKVGPVKTMARIDRPKRDKSYSANTEDVIDIAGLAWSVHRGISKVEVSIDEGEWLECELAGVPSDDTWRQWRYRWSDFTPGNHKVAARAYDGNGEVQPLGPKKVAPDGAEGYHTVNFKVA